MAQDTSLGQARTVPANVADVAANAGLGSFVRTFVPRRRNWFLLIFNLLVGLAMAVFLIGLWLLWVVLRTPNFSRSLNARRVYLYERGFVIAERPDDPQAYRFDAIDTVFQKVVSQRSYGIEVAKNYLYTVTARDGRTVKLTQFWADIDKLGPHLNSSVSQALLPGAVAAIEHGQGVRFDDMTLTAAAFAVHDKQVGWADVRSVWINNGYVGVNVTGRRLALSRTAAAKVPNLPLFFALAERLSQRG